jgi:hypothetical protein
MKTGLYFALLAFLGGLVVSIVLTGVVEAFLPHGHHANIEGITGLVFVPVWLVAIPATFIHGYRKQSRREAQTPPTPENLRPVDYSNIGSTLRSDERTQSRETR